MNLTELRNSKKMTMKNLAKDAGLDTSTVGRIEWGLSSPRVDTIEKMAKVLGVTPEVVFCAALETLKEGREECDQ